MPREKARYRHHQPQPPQNNLPWRWIFACLWLFVSIASLISSDIKPSTAIASETQDSLLSSLLNILGAAYFGANIPTKPKAPPKPKSQSKPKPKASTNAELKPEPKIVPIDRSNPAYKTLLKSNIAQIANQVSQLSDPSYEAWLKNPKVKMLHVVQANHDDSAALATVYCRDGVYGLLLDDADIEGGIHALSNDITEKIKLRQTTVPHVFMPLQTFMTAHKRGQEISANDFRFKSISTTTLCPELGLFANRGSKKEPDNLSVKMKHPPRHRRI